MMAFESISQLSNFILAMSALMGVVLAYFVAMRILRQQSIVKDSLKPIEDREFFSSEDPWKTSLERQIAELNRRLTDSLTEFKQVNHLLVDAENASLHETKNTEEIVSSPFLESMDIPPVFPRRNLIFVLTPFDKRENTTYSAIVEAFEGWGVEVLRGDELRLSSNILRHIVSLIAEANIVIANVASRNPNVMYELGIAHSLGKRVIMIANSLDSVPFDLRNQRILLYVDRKDLVNKLRNDVANIILDQSIRKTEQ